MLSLLCMVVVFGAHSLIDWTWYVPGNAIPALICARLAGRPRAAGTRRRRQRPARADGAGAAAARGRPGARCAWRSPPRVLGDDPRSLACVAVAAAAGRTEERSGAGDARRATRRGARSTRSKRPSQRDPLSVEALFVLSHIQEADAEHRRLARATLAAGGAPAALQPEDLARTWARIDLAIESRAARARRSSQARHLPEPRIDLPRIAGRTGSPEAIDDPQRTTSRPSGRARRHGPTRPLGKRAADSRGAEQKRRGDRAADRPSGMP